MGSFNRVLIKSVHARIIVYWLLLLLGVVALKSEPVSPTIRVVRGEKVTVSENVRFLPPEPVVVDQRVTEQSRVANSAPKQGTDQIASGSVDVNSATLTELQSLTGIGPVLAQRIVEYRETNGTFQSVAELKNVKGIGEITLQKLILQSVIASR